MRAKASSKRPGRVTRQEASSVEAKEETRTHEDKFRCPQCDRMVTVTAKYRRSSEGVDAMVQFDCTMDGMCGSPIWDPCPMYVAYMERAGRRIEDGTSRKAG
jgi:hypothetical protein